MGDHAIWAESPWFPPRWNRPIAPGGHPGWRRNQTSARVSRPSSVFCLAEWAAREEKRKHARKSPTKCRFGRAASVMYPVVVFILAKRKPMPAQQLSDVAVSAVLPLLFPRRHPPLVRTSVTSAKKLSESLRRLRRRCVVPRRTTPSRRNETDTRASSQRDRPFYGFRHCYFPGGGGHARGQDPSRTKNLHEARVWRCCLGYFSVGSDHVGGEITSNGK